MVTITDPSGTPSVVYNQDGTTISTLTASGTTQATAAAITRYSGRTIVIVTAASSQQGVILPSDADVGDIIEVYPSKTSTLELFVWPNSGASIGPGGTNGVFFTNSQGGMRLTYLASNLWGAISSS